MSRRSLSVALALLLAACGAKRPAPKPPQPPVAVWKTLLGEPVTAPLAASASRVFVATRDGAVRALEATTGALLWKADGLPGTLSAGETALLVRHEDGAVTRLDPGTGAVRWRAATGVAGTLPALVDRGSVLVAGKGLAALALETGELGWADLAATPSTAPPAATARRVITGEQDGTLRCRDREGGRTLWTLRTREPLLAPPLVDEARRRLYLGTADRRIVQVALDDGDPGWSFRVGADVAHAGLLQPERVLFASHDAVLYALARGGNLAWRGPLPSRPAGPPLAVDGRVVVACLENQVVAFDAATGAGLVSFKTPAEIRTAPVLAEGHVVLGMRDRSVIAYRLDGAPPAAAPDAAAPPKPSPPEATSAPAAPAAPAAPPPPPPSAVSAVDLGEPR